MLSMHELDNESAELLPGREALGKLSLNFTKSVTVTKHIANVSAHNQSSAGNWGSVFANAQSEGDQSIVIAQ